MSVTNQTTPVPERTEVLSPERPEPTSDYEHPITGEVLPANQETTSMLVDEATALIELLTQSPMPTMPKSNDGDTVDAQIGLGRRLARLGTMVEASLKGIEANLIAYAQEARLAAEDQGTPIQGPTVQVDGRQEKVAVKLRQEYWRADSMAYLRNHFPELTRVASWTVAKTQLKQWEASSDADSRATAAKVRRMAVRTPFVDWGS